jgi:D-amino-acid dehydrogenase
MNTHRDVVVIGGGVIGVCAAYYLALKGVNVTILEKGEIASGCSYGNGGLIVPSHAVPLASPGALGSGLRWLLDAESPFYIKPRVDLEFFNWLVRFAFASRHSRMMRAIPVLRDLLHESRALFDELSQNAGFDFEFEDNGSLEVYLSQRALEAGIEEAHHLEKFGIPSQAMSASEARDLEPALLTDVAGGIFHPRDAYINPARFVRGLAEKAQSLGAEILTGAEVLAFEAEKGRVVRINTTRGDFHAEKVILAAGSWSPEIARALKLRIPIQAAKGYSLTFEKPPICPRMALSLGEARVVVTPLAEGLRLAGTLELAGMDFSINARRVGAIHRAAKRYLPGLEDAKIIEIWRGLRPCTPDGLPIIGRSDSFENLFLAAGHAMLGMSLGPVTGKLISELVRGEKASIDLELLNAGRF